MSERTVVRRPRQQKTSRQAAKRKGGGNVRTRNPSTKAKRPERPWRKKSWRTWLWRFLALLVVVAIGAAAWLAWPFWHLSEQFGTTPMLQPSRLYGQATSLRHQAPWSQNQLIGRLEELHYQPATDDLVPGSFRKGDQTLEVYRQIFPSRDGLQGGDRLLIRFQGARIASLKLDGQAIESALLDPPLIASFYGDDLRERRPVGLDEIPEDLAYAVLAAEDAYFLEHSGISFKGILRAAWVNFRANEVRQGGSTLTQQLVKNIYLSHDRTLVRKLQEAFLAILLEWRYEKRAIFQAYLNEIYFGRSGSVQLMGVGAASWAYFGKRPAQLNLAESALLAGMIQSPVSYSPLRHPERAKERRNVILGRLSQLGWIQADRLEAAALAQVKVAQGPLVSRRAPYFSDFVEREARERFAIESLRDTGFTLLSTLDSTRQAAAEEAIGWGVEALEEGWEKGRKVSSPLQAALVSVDPKDGGLRAYVGGRSYQQSQFDRVSLAHRQVGSAFKPVVYAAAFTSGTAHPALILDDAPFTVRLAGQTWTPKNSDGHFRGQVTARRALEDSLNVPVARLAQQVGLQSIVDLAQRMGIEQKLDPYPAMALGAMAVTPLEMATVYSTLASGGKRPTLHAIEAVFDRHRQPVRGQPITPPESILSREVAYLVTDLLQGVLDRGTARKARTVHGIEDPLAGKTGTTNSRRDSWFAGYSPDQVTLVWVGYDDNTQTRLSGSRAALPIWSRFVYRVRPRGGYADFAVPAGIGRALIDTTTGQLATSRCTQVAEEIFVRELAPRQLCDLHSGLRARPLQQPDGIETDEERHPFKRFLQRIRNRGREP